MFPNRNTLTASALCAALLFPSMTPTACAQNTPASPAAAAGLGDGKPVLAADALLTTPVAGLENTGATQKVVPVTGQPFAKALRVDVAKEAKETNATQVMLTSAAPVEAGDALIATFYLRGRGADAKRPARAIVMFEKSRNPWTKSVIQQVEAPREADGWRRVLIPFTAAGSYAPGEAMLTVRLALGPQTVEIGGLSLVNYGKSLSRDALLERAAALTPLGAATVAVDLRQTRQTMVGLGGNYCKGRFGQTEPNDAVGRYTLENLNVAHARVGIPLEKWAPRPDGKFADEGPSHGTLLLMQQMAGRKIPLVASVWEAPDWMVVDPSKKSQKVIARDRWADCIEAIAQFLVTARDKYKAPVEYVSFNEADGGYNVKFTSQEIADFMKRAIPRFQQLGLKTKWLVGDTANGRALVNYARPLLEDKDLEPYLGPVSFHSWDALGAADTDYMAIAQLAKQYNRPVWCLEAGYDPQLWQANPPVWDTWDNAQKLSLAYHKAIRYAESSVIDYWEYQADYPLVGGKNGDEPYPAFFTVKQMATALAPGTQVVQAQTTVDGLNVLAAKDPKRKTFSVLLLNTTGAGSVTLTGLPKGAKLSLIRSSAAERMANVPGALSVDKDGRVTVPVTARSLTTVTGSL